MKQPETKEENTFVLLADYIEAHGAQQRLVDSTDLADWDHYVASRRRLTDLHEELLALDVASLRGE
jgi:hypothetical protein